MFSPFFGGSPYGYDVEETIPSLYGRRPMSRQQQAAYRAQQEQEMLRRQELLRQQELQRQQQALRQQQQRQAQYEAQLKKQAAEQERRRQALIKYTAAATVIQRWFRAARAARAARLARATALKRAAAGRVVLRTLRSVAAVREAKRLAAQLRKLAALRAEVDKFVAEHAGAALSAGAGAATPTTVPKALLAYADRLEKLLLKLDNISHGSDLFRASRKALAAHIQTLLAAADARRHQIEHDAEDLQAGEQLCKLLDGTFDRIEEERLRRDRETTASLTLQRWWRASSRALAARRVARIAAETASAAADFAKQLRALQARLQATPHAAAAPDHQRAAHQIQTWLQQLGN